MGVSKATLSQIEANKTNPTIGVLWKIASGLGVPFSDLLGEQGYEGLRRRLLRAGPRFAMEYAVSSVGGP